MKTEELIELSNRKIDPDRTKPLPKGGEVTCSYGETCHDAPAAHAFINGSGKRIALCMQHTYLALTCMQHEGPLPT